MRNLATDTRTRYLAGLLVVGVVVALAAFFGQGVPAVSVPLRTGQAWLENARNGTVSLIDGFSGGSVGQARAANVAGRLSVINTPNGAVVVDASGHINRVSNSSMTAGRPRAIFSNTTAAAGAGKIYAVDEATGDVQELASRGTALNPVGPTVHLHSAISSALVDGAGKLWAALPQKGMLADVQDGKASSVGGVGSPGDSIEVTAADSRVVATNLTARSVTPIGFGSTVQLPADAAVAANASVVGSDTLSQVAIVSTGGVVSVNLRSHDVRTIALPAGTKPDASVMAGADVDLIDSATGAVLVVHTDSGRVDPPITLPSGRPDELLVKDGQVFVNDSNGAGALVLHPDGTTSDVTKYTARTTKQALHPPKPPASVLPPPASTQLPSNTGGGAAKGSRPGGPPAPIGPGPRTQPPVQPKQAKPGAPGVPGGVTLTSADTSVLVGWAAAAANGSNVDSYLISWVPTLSPTTAKGTYTFSAHAGAALQHRIEDLDNGTEYTVTVTAHNGHGNGLPSEPKTAIPSNKIADTPSSVAAVASAPNTVTVTWTASDSGYHIAGYRVFTADSSSTVPVADNITGTTASFTVDPSTIGSPTQFAVQAIGSPGTADSSQSKPSNVVTPYGPPQPPTVATPTSSDDGTSTDVDAVCDQTCLQGGTSSSMSLDVEPAPTNGEPADVATTDGHASFHVDHLVPGTQYTVAAKITTQGGTSDPTAPPPTFSTHGPPTVSGINPGTADDGRTLVIHPAVSSDEPATCTVSVDGGNDPSKTDGCGAEFDMHVPTWFRTYNVHVTATNAAGSSGDITFQAQAAAKAVVADATDAFGNDCSGGKKYCGGDSSSLATTEYKSGGDGKKQGTPLTLQCWTDGDKVTGYGAYSNGRTTWVRISEDSAKPWMSILYFPSPDSVIDGLDHC